MNSTDVVKDMLGAGRDNSVIQRAGLRQDDMDRHVGLVVYTQLAQKMVGWFPIVFQVLCAVAKFKN